jgi:hypothetical protein
MGKKTKWDELFTAAGERMAQWGLNSGYPEFKPCRQNIFNLLGNLS